MILVFIQKTLNYKEKNYETFITDYPRGGGVTTNSSSLKKAFKPLIASSLAITLGVSVASGTTTCSATNPYACFVYGDDDLSSNFPQNNNNNGTWQSFKDNSSGNFGSLTGTADQITFTTKEGVQATGYLGQVAGIAQGSAKKYLGIALGGTGGSKLIFDNVSGAWKDLHVGIYVDAKGIPSGTNSSGDTADANTLLQIKSESSVMIGNIRVTNSGTISVNPTQKNVAVLTFNGNHAIAGTDLQKFETANQQQGERPLSDILSKRDANYALIGGIANSSGAKVIATFSGGAKMYGDLYTASSGGSKNKVTFNGDSGTAQNAQLRYVFEGGMLSVHGDNEVIVKKGDVFLDSVTFGNFGMLGQNNGCNQLTFGDATPKLGENPSGSQPAQAGTASNVTALSISAKTDADNSNAKTGNFIYFVNTASTANTMNVQGTISANSGANIIQTLGQETTGSTKTALNLTVRDSINTSKNSKATTYNDDYNYNKIIINGNLEVGKEALTAMKTSDGKGVKAGSTLGIVSRAGKNNAIILADTSTAIALDYTTLTNQIGTNTANANAGITSVGTTYNTHRSLTTARIYANGADTNNPSVNTVKIDGDITLVYRKADSGVKPARNDVIFGDIQAIGVGATNDITIGGIIKSEKVGNSSSSLAQDTMLIVSDSGGTNKITINNKKSNGEAMSFGKFLSSGGSNSLVITNNVNTNNTATTIASVIATNKKMESGNPDIGGANELFFEGGKVTITDIKTIGTGRNTFAFTANGTTNTTAEGTLNFSEAGGTNTIYFGVSDNGSNSVAGQKVMGVKAELNNGGVASILSYNLATNGAKSLTLTFGDSSGKSSYFKGSISSTDESGNNFYTNKINYVVEKNGVFVGNINKKTTISGASVTNQTLTLKDGAKFVLDFAKSTAKQDNNTMVFSTLGLEKSTNADTNYKLATESMKGTIVDIATDGVADVSKVADHRAGTARTLQVTSLSVNGAGTNAPLFRLYTEGVGKSDNVVINNKVSSTTNIEAQVFLSADMINHDFGADNTKTIIFTNKGGIDSALELGTKTKTATTGFTSYSLGITKGTQDNNTIWYLGSIQDKQVNTEAVEYTTSAMGINYGIFVQNINSLNKRMGELRNNDDTQGVWARVFTGKQTSTMDLIPSDSTYVTVQGGYDYGFGVTGGTNYLGVALSYGYTSSETDRSTNAIASITGYSSKSSNIEVAVYNSYIQDEGWFSDTIAKFGYIMSDFDIYEQSSTQKQSLSNFALSLGQEVGYRFALGSEKNWFIDPQVELVAGYINSTDLSQAQGGQTLDGKLDSVFLFRTRVGSDFGYSLKKDKNQYDFRLGLSYEYDVANADAFFDIASANMSKVFSNAVDNDGRVVLNLGTNMKFGENMRLYFDFEKSFAGKITTDYQVNLGFRYGFGEKLVKVVEETNTQEQPQNQVQ